MIMDETSQDARNPAPNLRRVCGGEGEGSGVTDTESLVIADIKSRQEKGIAKYGVTVAGNPLSLREWLQHSYEEKLDDLIYMKRAIQEMDRQK